MKRRHDTVRLSNLELLVAEAGSAAALARLAATSESYLSQIRNQLLTAKGTPRGVGDELAAKLEQAMGKPHGWMDESHQDFMEERARYNAEPGPALGDAEDLLPCPVRCSPDTFVLRVRGESMEPKFHDGDLIFVDPEAAPLSGRYVVVRLEDSHEATFKQLIVEGDRQFLKAMNPDWPQRIIEVDSNATICGVVVFKGEVV